MNDLEIALKNAQVSPNDLLDWLTSESVYTALRFADKSPSKCGIDDVNDRDVYKLYDLVSKLKK
jgi:hypothetical protein